MIINLGHGCQKEKSNVPADKLALYDTLISTIGGLERKGATVPYTSVNGHMFSLLDEVGVLGLRLPKGVLEEFIAKYNTSLREAYCIVQKEYVIVPPKLFENTAELQPYFAKSYEYVKGLKPKPSAESK